MFTKKDECFVFICSRTNSYDNIYLFFSLNTSAVIIIIFLNHTLMMKNILRELEEEPFYNYGLKECGNNFYGQYSHYYI